LTPHEVARYALIGVQRRLSNIAKKTPAAHGRLDSGHGDEWQIDIEGVLAEAAVAKALNVYFAPSIGRSDKASGDVMGLQVRSTRYATGRLLVHKGDADGHRFLLVTGSEGDYTIRGWLTGQDAKRFGTWKTHKGRSAYWVEQNFLKPFKAEDFDVR
jgi:hypothetical protein